MLLGEWQILRLGQEKHKMSLKHLVKLESQETDKKTKKLKMTRECQKDTGADLKEFLVKAGTFEQQHK